MGGSGVVVFTGVVAGLVVIVAVGVVVIIVVGAVVEVEGICEVGFTVVDELVVV